MVALQKLLRPVLLKHLRKKHVTILIVQLEQKNTNTLNEKSSLNDVA